MYGKTTWVDQVTDPGTGQVVQAGTKVTATRLNNLESGVEKAHSLSENLAKDLVGSFVTSGLVFTTSGLTANYTAGAAYVNGVRFDVVAGSITLNATQGQYIYLDSDGVIKNTTYQATADAKCLLWYFATDASSVITTTDKRNIVASTITVDPAQAPTGNTGKWTEFFSWFANRLEAITGKNWQESPTKTMEQLNTEKANLSGAAFTGGVSATLIQALNTTGRQIVAGWADLSNNENGFSLFGNNCYTDGANNYRYSYTHASLGARGIRLSASGSIEFFDTGAVATTAGALLTPTWNPVLHSGNGVRKTQLATVDWNNYTTTGFYDGEGLLNACPAGIQTWRYCHVVNHSYDPTNFVEQIMGCFDGTGGVYRRVKRIGEAWTPWFLVSQHNNLKQSMYDKDTVKGLYRVIDHLRKSDNSRYAQTYLSVPDANGNYTSLKYTYYGADGITVIRTDEWTITYDSDGLITSKVPNF